jgi:hypothetical protein
MTKYIRLFELGLWGTLAFQLGLAVYASLSFPVRRGDFIGAPMAGAPLAVAFGVAVAEVARRNLGAIWPRFLMWATRGYVLCLCLALFLIHFDATKQAGEAAVGLLLVVGISVVAVPFLPFFMFSFFGSHAFYKVPAMAALGLLGALPIALLIGHAVSRERNNHRESPEPA